MQYIIILLIYFKRLQKVFLKARPRPRPRPRLNITDFSSGVWNLNRTVSVHAADDWWWLSKYDTHQGHH